MRGTWTILGVTLAIQAIISAAALSVAVLALKIAVDAGVAVSLIGVQIGIIYAGAAASSLVAGGIVNFYGPVRTSQFALLVAALGVAVTMIGSLGAITAGAMLIGLGYGVVTPASSSLLARGTPPERMGFVFSLKQTGVPLGGALAGVLLPPITELLGWRMALGTLALACLGVAWLAQIVQRPLDHGYPQPGGTRDRLGPLKMLLGKAPLRRLALVSIAFAAMQLILSGYLVAFLTESRGFALAQAGIVLALAQAAGVGGRLLWGWAADRFMTARGVLAALAFASAFCAAVFAAQSDAGPELLLVAIAAIFGAVAIGWNGVFLAEIARLSSREHVAGSTGAALFFTYAGVMIGPPVFAMIVATGGYAQAFTAAAVLMAATALLLIRGGGPRTTSQVRKPI